MKKRLFVILVVLIIGFWSCQPQDIRQPFETTVTVEDMDGKPIVGKIVKVFGSSSNTYYNDTIRDFYARATDSATTDKNGKVVLHYELVDRTDISPLFALIVVKDDAQFKAVNYINHESSHIITRAGKFSGTIKMDSLVPFSLRLKTNRDDVKNILYDVSSFSYISKSATG